MQPIHFTQSASNNFANNWMVKWSDVFSNVIISVLQCTVITETCIICTLNVQYNRIWCYSEKHKIINSGPKRSENDSYHDMKLYLASLMFTPRATRFPSRKVCTFTVIWNESTVTLLATATVTPTATPMVCSSATSMEDDKLQKDDSWMHDVNCVEIRFDIGSCNGLQAIT